MFRVIDEYIYNKKENRWIQYYIDFVFSDNSMA